MTRSFNLTPLQEGMLYESVAAGQPWTNHEQIVVHLEGEPVDRAPTHITWTPSQAEKGGYRHFMLKEIHEQPRAMADTLRGRLSLETGEVHLEDVHIKRPGSLAVYQLEPRVLLLDEPLAALDPAAKARALERLGGWVEETGGAILMVTHDAATLAPWATRCAELGSTAREPDKGADS